MSNQPKFKFEQASQRGEVEQRRWTVYHGSSNATRTMEATFTQAVAITPVVQTPPAPNIRVAQNQSPLSPNMLTNNQTRTDIPVQSSEGTASSTLETQPMDTSTATSPEERLAAARELINVILQSKGN